MKIFCLKCKNELSNFGGLLFSPPRSIEDELAPMDVEKIHLCSDCYKKVVEFINGTKNDDESI